MRSEVHSFSCDWGGGGHSPKCPRVYGISRDLLILLLFRISPCNALALNFTTTNPPSPKKKEKKREISLSRGLFKIRARTLTLLDLLLLQTCEASLQHGTSFARTICSIIVNPKVGSILLSR